MSESLHPALEPPRNESPTHYALKEVALWWLRRTGSWIVADEVDVVYDLARLGKGRRFHRIADAVGLRRVWVAGTYKWISKVVEVKVSRADWQAGYCTGGHLLYLMTPPGILRPDEVETGVGFIEVDLEQVEWTWQGTPRGVRTVKRATRAMPPWDDGQASSLLQSMASRLSAYRLSHNEVLGPYAQRLVLGEEGRR